MMERAGVIPGWVWVVVIWMAMFLPNAGRRELRWEEGRRGLQVRAMFEEGHWIQPTVYGKPYLTKPPMLPWAMAISSYITGGLNEWAIRLPGLIAVLLSGCLVYGWVARRASSADGVFAAVAFFLCPLVLEKACLGETDTMVTCCSFAAFSIWLKPWRLWVRVLVAALILNVGVLAKGPPALLYFACGMLGYLVWERQFRHLPILLLTLVLSLVGVLSWAAVVYRPEATHLWLSEMGRNPQSGFRLGAFVLNSLGFLGGIIGGSMPWCLLALMPLAFRFKKNLASRCGIDVTADKALMAYACAGTLLLVFWPGTRSRYALPMMPAVAVAAGLAFSSLRTSAQLRSRRLANILMGLVALAVCGVGGHAVIRKYPEQNRQLALRLNPILDNSPVYMLAPGDHNLLFYVKQPVGELTARQLATLASPITLIYWSEKADAVRMAGVQPNGVTEIGNRKKTLCVARIDPQRDSPSGPR